LDDELKWGEEPPAWSSYSDSIASFAAVFTASATILTAKRDVAAIAMPPWHRNKFEKLTETARCSRVFYAGTEERGSCKTWTELSL
jgi:hypothetical protein